MATKKQILKAMRVAYAQINALHFNGKLPRCYFYLADLSKENWHGYHSTRKDGEHRITFDTNTPWNYYLINCITAHEMIHAYQWMQKSERTRREIHGRFFQYHHRRIFGFRYTIGAY